MFLRAHSVQNLLRLQQGASSSGSDSKLSPPEAPLESLGDEANRILGEAEKKEVLLRLLGGVAVVTRCPSAAHPPFSRRYVDIDLIGRRKETAKINQLFKDLGYKPRERFNALHGSRLIFNDMKNARRVDIFLDTFQMCHKFDFRDRLSLEPKTITMSDLLMTKLQIVEVNEKDIKDILVILLDHDVVAEEAPDKINAAYIAKISADDWGIYRTLTMSLDRVPEFVGRLNLDGEQKARVMERAVSLRKSIEGAPKSMGWKMRAAVGDRKRWYELPEADQAVVDFDPSSAEKGASG